MTSAHKLLEGCFVIVINEDAENRPHLIAYIGVHGRGDIGVLAPDILLCNPLKAPGTDVNNLNTSSTLAVTTLTTVTSQAAKRVDWAVWAVKQNAK